MASTSTSGNSSNVQRSKEAEDDNFIPGYKDISEFTQAGFQAVMGAIKSSNDLPSSGDDFDYYSSFESFGTLMNMEGARILDIIQKIMRHHGTRGNMKSRADHVDTEEKFDVLVDANDQLLERVGLYLDEASGLRKQESPLVLATAVAKSNNPISGSWNKKSTKGISLKSNYRLLAAKNILRPQLKFKDKVDNSSKPFVPLIKEKPNALKSLSESLQIDADSTVDQGFQFPHPYQYELEQFAPLPSQVEKGTITEPKPLEDCPPNLIETESDLKNLVKLLKNEKEIAIDLEHHSYRTFQGITCLMQLSTRSQDFIIDVILLRNEMHIMNQIFTDSNIIKVFHGADLDIEWLQRDLGLYIVNMFDTGQAARVLNLQRFSLAHLLANYCNVQADKQFQLADWRIRPLPMELVNYAQEDTHYLLYIYDRLRTELIDRGNDQNNLLMSVLQRSKAICGKTYKKAIFSTEDYMEMYKRTKKVFNSQQLTALKDIYAWRDSMARAEDESLGYVLPNHMLMQMCEVLPREPQGVLACCNPIPPLVRQNLMDIHSLIKAARDKPLVKPVQSPRTFKPTKLQHPKYDATSLLCCPHDMSHREKHIVTDMDIDVPKAKNSALFKDEADIRICAVEIKGSPIISAFGDNSQPKTKRTKAQKKAAKIKARFVNPIEKFLPDAILERISEGKSTQLTETEEKWKLMPHTQKPVATQVKAPSRPGECVPSADLITVDIDEPEEALSVRHQYSKPKKRESDGKTDVAAKKMKEVEEFLSKVKAESKVKPESKKKDEFVAPKEDFKAYDYSTTDYNVFDKADKKGKKKHYDPDSEATTSKHKRGLKSKGHSKSENKSMTYNKGKSTASKIQWPKR